MRVLDSVACGNQYTEAAGIKYIYRSNGGSFSIVGADAYCRLWYGDHGHETPLAEFHAPVGVGVIYPGTIGVEFRNYLAGQTAIVSATLSQEGEPSVALGAGGVAGAGSGSMNLIQSVLVGAPVANVDFQGIPSTYTHLRIIWEAASSVAALSTTLELQLNGVSGGGSYDRSMLFVRTAYSVGAVNGATSIVAGELKGASATAGAASGGEILIPNYAQATLRKEAVCSGAGKVDLDGSGQYEPFFGGGEARSTSAVARVTLFPTLGNFIAGSQFSLYGIS